MSTKSKLRLVVAIRGQNIELLSVRERTSGELLLTPRSPSGARLGHVDLREIAEQHFSIHRSKDDKNTAVTFKQTFADGSSLDNVAYIHDTKDHLLWPIFARQVGVSAEILDKVPPARAKDTLVALGGYHPEAATLCFSIFIARRDFAVIQGVEDVNVLAIPFRLFKIIVLWGFFNIPSPETGQIAGITTSSTIRNGEKQPHHSQIKTNSFAPEELLPTHHVLVGELAQKLYNDVTSGLPDHPVNADLRTMLGFTTARPLVNVP
jgi:hypothetical protein